MLPMSKYLKFLKKNQYYILLFIILFSFLFLFKNLLLIIGFIIIGAISVSHIRFTQGYFGFELCTLFTVLGAMKFGALAGVIIGISSITLGLFLGGYIKHSIIVNIFGFALIGFIASFIPITNLFYAGILLALLYDILAVPSFHFLGAPKIVIISYFLSHMITTFFIFSWAANILVL